MLVALVDLQAVGAVLIRTVDGRRRMPRRFACQPLDIKSPLRSTNKWPPALLPVLRVSPMIGYYRVLSVLDRN